MPRPEQQTVLITGGSRGIGAASVLAFAKAGYRVAFTWHSSADAARRVVETVQQTVTGSTVLAILADAADSAQVRDAVARLPGNWADLRFWCATRALPSRNCSPI